MINGRLAGFSSDRLLRCLSALGQDVEVVVKTPRRTRERSWLRVRGHSGMNAVTPVVPPRAALYLRVSTARQTEHDVSIADQRRQKEAYCTARGYQLLEPGALATNDCRPEFRPMMKAGTVKPPVFDMVVVHSFSRSLHDRFELAFGVFKCS